MANKKVPTQSGESPVEATAAAAEAQNSSVAVEYTIEELTAGAKTVFPGISPDCVTAALRLAGITKTTKENAKEIVDKFVNAPVAGPKKGGN